MTTKRISFQFLIFLLTLPFSSHALKIGRRKQQNEDVIKTLPDLSSPKASIFPDNNSDANGKSHRVPNLFMETFDFIQPLLLYKPPFGLSAIFVMVRLLRLRRYRLQKSSAVLDSIDSLEKKKVKRRGRAFDIDSSDREFKEFGGIIPIRAEYCYQRLKSLQVTSEEDSQLKEASLQVLKLSINRNGVFEDFVKKSAHPVSNLFALLQKNQNTRKDSDVSERDNFGGKTQESTSVDQDIQVIDQDPDITETPNIEDVFVEAANIGEVRLLDALLRALRGKLLVTTRNMDYDKQFCARRQRFFEDGAIGNIFQMFRATLVGTTLEDDRRDLVMARAAVQQEKERLGKVQKMLLDRPSDSNSTILMFSNHTNVLNDHRDDKEKSYVIKIWNDEAHAWIAKARNLLFEMLSDYMSDADEEGRKTTVAQDLITLSAFAKNDYENEEAWKTGLYLVDGLLKVQKRRQDRIYSYVKRFSQEIDFFGIPSSLAILYIAQVLHNGISPYWKTILQFLEKSYTVVKGIFIFRFWEPFREISLDLLNRRPRLVEHFTQLNEEQSLDNMLRDLGVSEGNRETRDVGIAAASRLYEEELNRGPIRSAISGQLVRLLLVQVQILKTSLFEAMGSIDHLVDSNRLNVQLLAAIPAFLFIKWGTRVFFTSLFRFRSRDLRPTNEVLNNMSDYLSQIERSLLLSGFTKDGHESLQSLMQPADLGEIVFLVHSYLILLDYVCPPTQTKLRNSLQNSMQDLLLQGKPIPSQQLAMLKLVNKKHESLTAKLILL